MRSCRETSRSMRCGAWTPGSTRAMRRGTGSTATPSGTGRAARSASARRSGCGPRSTSLPWQRRRRSSSAGTTSVPSAGRIDNRSGPSTGSGSADEAGRSRSTWSATPSCARWSGASRRPSGRPDGRSQAPSPPPRGYACGGSSSDGPSDRGTEMMTTKTYTPRESEIERRWFVVDATDETLGRLASRIARVLEGKHKPTFATHIDSGDHVIVVNAARIAVSRNKLESKLYIRHSGYPHGLKQETLGELLARRPEEAIRRAVKGMLPRNRLGAQQLRKLKVYAGAEHPHQAQRPEPLA